MKFSIRYNTFRRTAHAATRALAKWDPKPLPIKLGRLVMDDLIPDMLWGGETTTRGGLGCWETGEGTGVVMYLHGGGYVAGSSKVIKGLGVRLARTAGVRVVGVDYRLAPEYPLPCATEDAVAVYRTLLEEGFKGICIAGDSAGGGLTLLTIQRLISEGLPPPSCAVAVSPFADLTCTAASHTTNSPNDVFLGGFPHSTFTSTVDMMIGNATITGEPTPNPPNNPASPVYSPVNGSFESFPPLKIMVGDTEVLLDDSRNVAKNAIASGVHVELEIAEGMCHSYPLFTPMFPEAAKAVDRMAEFVRKYV